MRAEPLGPLLQSSCRVSGAQGSTPVRDVLPTATAHTAPCSRRLQVPLRPERACWAGLADALGRVGGRAEPALHGAPGGAWRVRRCYRFSDGRWDTLRGAARTEMAFCCGTVPAGRPCPAAAMHDALGSEGEGRWGPGSPSPRRRAGLRPPTCLGAAGQLGHASRGLTASRHGDCPCGADGWPGLSCGLGHGTRPGRLSAGCTPLEPCRRPGGGFPEAAFGTPVATWVSPCSQSQSTSLTLSGDAHRSMGTSSASARPRPRGHAC